MNFAQLARSKFEAFIRGDVDREKRRADWKSFRIYAMWLTRKLMEETDGIRQKQKEMGVPAEQILDFRTVVWFLGWYDNLYFFATPEDAEKCPDLTPAEIAQVQKAFRDTGPKAQIWWRVDKDSPISQTIKRSELRGIMI